MSQKTSSSMRFNITLPANLGNKLKKTSNRSAFISDALRQKFAVEEKLKLDEQLAEGYKKSAIEDRELVREWDATVGDGI